MLKIDRVLLCQSCGRQVVTRSARKIFCDPCGLSRRLNSGRRHQGRARQMLSVNRPELAALMAEKSADMSASLIDAFARRPAYAWEVYLATPFTLNASKNRRWSNTGKGAVFLNAGVRSYQDYLILAIRSALGGQPVRHAKLWVSLHVQKPDHRSDAINVVDTICDAIKKAAGLDDRWFSIDRVDWEVNKKDPQIFIKIGQEAVEDSLVCSHCGFILGLDKFTKNKSGPFGRNRACVDCSRLIDRARRVSSRVA